MYTKDGLMDELRKEMDWLFNGFYTDARIASEDQSIALADKLADRGVKRVEGLYSGGGCTHIFFLMKSGHIVSINHESESVEVSLEKYECISSYIDGDDTEWGYENMKPLYDERSLWGECKVVSDFAENIKAWDIGKALDLVESVTIDFICPHCKDKLIFKHMNSDTYHCLNCGGEDEAVKEVVRPVNQTVRIPFKQ